jgi:nickel-dependent lactate racemase
MSLFQIGTGSVLFKPPGVQSCLMSGAFRAFRAPPGSRVTVVKQKPSRPLPSLRDALVASLADPLAGPPLGDMVGRGDTAALLFTDATRACPDRVILPLLVRELRRCGVGRRDILLVCARGMHRPSTVAERRMKLGPLYAAGYRVIDSEPLQRGRLVRLGTTRRGVPVLVDRAAADADMIMSTGIVEPHQYAGYSGGAKTLAIGAAGQATIAATHGPRFIDAAGCFPGNLENNPFQEALWEIADRVGLRFLVNVVLDDRHRPLAAASGDPRAVHAALARKAASVFERSVRGLADAAVVFAPSPKDRSLYQASRAVTYLSLSPRCPVRPGGAIVLVASLDEGFGMGTGEKRFAQMMRRHDASAIVDRLAGGKVSAGQQRAYMLARTLLRHRVFVVGGARLACGERRRLVFERSIEDALAQATAGVSRPRILAVPNATEIIVRAQEF